MLEVDYRKYAKALPFLVVFTLFSLTSLLWMLKYSGKIPSLNGQTEQTIIGPEAAIYDFLKNAIAFAVLYVLVAAAVRYLGADKKSTDCLLDSLKSPSIIFLLGVLLNLLQYFLFASYSLVSIIFVPFFAFAYMGVGVIKRQKKGERAYYFLFAIFAIASLWGAIDYAYNLFVTVSMIQNLLKYLGVFT